MQLPQRSDRAVEESKNPLNAGGVGKLPLLTLGDFHPLEVIQPMTLNSNDPMTLSRIDGALRVACLCKDCQDRLC